MPQSYFTDSGLKDNEGVIFEHLENCSLIIYQYSGGKDSQIAMEYIHNINKKYDLNKDEIIYFVDTQSEIPSIIKHVKTISEQMHIDLKILECIGTEAYIRKKGHFPHPIYKDCIKELINKPVNTEAKNKDAVIITGHTNKQRNGKSSMKFISYVNKTQMIINPIYSMFDDEYNYYMNNTKMWGGYKLGYMRTACYCCPFQKKDHWETMKRYDNDLWKKMYNLLEEFPIVALTDRPSEGVAVASVEPYWNGCYGCKVRKTNLTEGQGGK